MITTRELKVDDPIKKTADTILGFISKAASPKMVAGEKMTEEALKENQEILEWALRLHNSMTALPEFDINYTNLKLELFKKLGLYITTLAPNQFIYLASVIVGIHISIQKEDPLSIFDTDLEIIKKNFLMLPPADLPATTTPSLMTSIGITSPARYVIPGVYGSPTRLVNSPKEAITQLEKIIASPVRTVRTEEAPPTPKQEQNFTTPTRRPTVVSSPTISSTPETRIKNTPDLKSGERLSRADRVDKTSSPDTIVVVTPVEFKTKPAKQYHHNSFARLHFREDPKTVEEKESIFGTELFMASFYRCNFENIDFNNKLEGTKFINCSLINCSFAEIHQPTFTECNFNNVDFSKIHPEILKVTRFENCYFTNCILSQDYARDKEIMTAIMPSTSSRALAGEGFGNTAGRHL